MEQIINVENQPTNKTEFAKSSPKQLSPKQQIILNNQKKMTYINSGVSEIDTVPSLSEVSFNYNNKQKITKKKQNSLTRDGQFEEGNNILSNVSQSQEQDLEQSDESGIYRPRNYKFIDETEEIIESIQETDEENLISIDKHLYLCPPTALSLDYCINPWMKLESPFSQEEAMKQWTNLFELYRKLCGPKAVTRVEPKEKLTELCFFGDSIFAIGNQCVFSRFSCAERYDETDYVIDYALQKMKLQGTMLPQEMFFEGSGETMMWNGKILVGYGKRNSSPEVADFLEETFGCEAIGLELIDQRFYHLDTALFPINKDLIAVYEPAFSEASIRKINNLGVELIKLTYEDALQFACNSVSLDGKNLVIHYEAKNFIQQLRNRGFIVHTVDISEFIKFGGGLKCLTFQHYNGDNEI